MDARRTRRDLARSVYWPAMNKRERKIAAQLARAGDVGDDMGLLRSRILRLAMATDPTDDAAMAKSRLMVWMMEVLARLGSLELRSARLAADEGLAELASASWDEAVSQQASEASGD